MICESCGKQIRAVFINIFNIDGHDMTVRKPIVETPTGAVYFETTRDWTGYELTEEEMIEDIKCPCCGKFPFKHKEVQVYDVVRVVCFEGEDA